MQTHADEIAARGARVVAIGQGGGDYAAEFCASLGAGFTCLGDPERAAYRAFSLPRGSVWSVVVKGLLDDPRLGFSRLRRASVRGSLLPQTDVLQLPGVAIVDRAGRVRFMHRAKTSDDLPANAALLEALDSL
jgi:hypothetical protein